MATNAGITGFASVVIPVPDQDRALAFYCDTLGLAVVMDISPGPGFRWIELAPPKSSTTIALAVPRGGMWRSVGGDTNISLRCVGIEAEHDRLGQLGVDVDEQVLRIPGVPSMFRFRDPFANILQIVAATTG